jgi:hypothetical protein
MDEHRDDHAALLGERASDLLVQSVALLRVDGGVRLEQQRVVVGPLPMGLLPLGVL